jgi:hypothetical protein
MYEEKFAGELQEGEKILWTGKPEAAVVFTAGDFFLVPFSLMWGGFAIFWESMALFAFFGSDRDPAALIFPLFGIPFVLIGLYFIFGRFLYKKKRKEMTFYALTDSRAIILTNWPRQRMESVNLKQISSLQKSAGKKGIGNVVFGNSFGFGSMYQNTGMELLSPQTPSIPAFYDIKDVDLVYNKALNLR